MNGFANTHASNSTVLPNPICIHTNIGCYRLSLPEIKLQHAHMHTSIGTRNCQFRALTLLVYITDDSKHAIQTFNDTGLLLTIRSHL